MAHASDGAARREVPGLGRAVTRIGLGGWLTLGAALDERASLGLLRQAFDGGIDLLDLADVYAEGAAERVVGAFLREVDRDRLVVTSKVFWPTAEGAGDRGLSRRHVHASIDRSLRRLGVDHIDVYFCHREDPDTPLAETVQAMGDLVRVGKVRVWGTSCWRPASLHRAHQLAAELGVAPPRIEQPPLSLLERGAGREALPACLRLGMGAFVWSPLAGGCLTGKYLAGAPAGSRGAHSSWTDRYRTPAAVDAVRRFVAVCKARELAPAAVALAWAASQPGVTAALTGATSPTQLQENLTALRLLARGEDLRWAAAAATAGWPLRVVAACRRLVARNLHRIRY